jgi:hypothetical protein
VYKTSGCSPAAIEWTNVRLTSTMEPRGVRGAHNLANTPNPKYGAFPHPNLRNVASLFAATICFFQRPIYMGAIDHVP